MQTNPGRNEQNTDSRNSSDPRERNQQNPSLNSDEIRENTSHGDKNDNLLNEDPNEERRAIEESSEEDFEETSEDNLEEAE